MTQQIESRPVEIAGTVVGVATLAVFMEHQATGPPIRKPLWTFKPAPALVHLTTWALDRTWPMLSHLRRDVEAQQDRADEQALYAVAHDAGEPPAPGGGPR